jgi:hypothetical protein
MRRRSSTAAAFAVVLLVAGQLAALAHEAATRHVVCSEHGELLEAPTPSSVSSAPDDSQHAHLVGIDGVAGEHEDCVIARAMRQSTKAPDASAHVVVTTDMATNAPRAPIDSVLSFEQLFLIAPKTSPPA